MVGKNNDKVKKGLNAEKVSTYSIRKLKNGIASVAIGGLLVGAIAVNPEAANAAEADATANQVEITQATEGSYIDPVTTETQVITGRVDSNYGRGLNLFVNPTRGGSSSKWRTNFFPEADGTFAVEVSPFITLEAGDTIQIKGGNQITGTIDMTVTVTEASTVDPAVEAARSSLSDLIDEVEANHEEADYTPETWAALEVALQAADAEVASEDATVESLENAEAALQDAVANLVTVEEAAEIEAARTELSELIADVSANYDAADYTSNSWAAVADALQAAEAEVDNTDATVASLESAASALEGAVADLITVEEQEVADVIAAIDGLVFETANEWSTNNYPPEVASVREAYDALSEEQQAQVTNYEELLIAEARVDAHSVYIETFLDVLPESEYTDETWAPFADARTNLINQRNSPESTVESISNAISAYEEAMANLVTLEEAAVEEARTTLAELIEAVEANIEEADYTPETWAAVVEALEAAEAEVANTDATVDSLEAAEGDLQAAVDALVTVEEQAWNDLLDRLAELENRLDEVEAENDALATEVEDLRAELAELREDQVANEERIAELEARLAELEDRVEEVEEEPAPEEPAPEEPAPEEPAPEGESPAPEAPNAEADDTDVADDSQDDAEVLPQTGASTAGIGYGIASLLSGLGLAFVNKKRKEDE